MKNDLTIEKAIAGESLTAEEGLALYQRLTLIELGQLADQLREQKHPDGIVTYIIDRNINYTNVCYTDCKFCAFYVPVGEGGYLLSNEEIGLKIEETIAQGGVEILMQGGHNPELGIAYYEELFHYIKSRYPIHLHALSPPEIIHISKVSKIPVEEVIDRLVASGLDSIPGGGAEILVDRVRKEIAPKKCSSADWLDVMRVAHQKELRTTATMMYGTTDTVADRVEHMLKIRELQAETGGFTAFIPWPYQASPELDLPAGDTSAHTYLRTLALSRLLLPNVENLQVSWLTVGPGVAQLGLRFGANDFSNIFLEENVVRAAGASHTLTAAETEAKIREIGFIPRQRNTFYEIIN